MVEISKQDGEAQIRERWRWAEPSVWTERMLTALEEGVKGGKWFSFDGQGIFRQEPERRHGRK